MPDTVALRFHGGGRAIDFDPGELEIQVGDAVVAETENGLELGIAASDIRWREPRHLSGKLRPVLRFATDEDLERYEENREREREAFRICRSMIDEHGLDMRLVDACYTLDGQRLLFYFTADGRVDFRQLVRDLAVVFHRRIELRQIGIRDEARMIGGVGICGREYCCSSWMTAFVPVSVRMAKTQNLSMNPAKISGSCGRLLCCLKYEEEHYEQARRRAPRGNSVISTPRGQMRVVHVDLLHEQVEVMSLDEGNEERYRYAFDELDLPRPGERRERGGRQPREERGGQERGGRRDARRRDEDAAAAPAEPEPVAEPAAEPEAEPAAAPAPEPEKPAPRAPSRRRGRRRIGRPAGSGFLPHPVDPAQLPQQSEGE